MSICATDKIFVNVLNFHKEWNQEITHQLIVICINKPQPNVPKRIHLQVAPLIMTINHNLYCPWQPDETKGLGDTQSPFYLLAGMNFKEMLLTQCLSFVGVGNPSPLKTWPKCPPHAAHVISIRYPSASTWKKVSLVILSFPYFIYYFISLSFSDCWLGGLHYSIKSDNFERTKVWSSPWSRPCLIDHNGCLHGRLMPINTIYWY